MNTKLSASGRPVVVAAEKITKGEIDKALAEGTTHVKFKSHKVQRRMMKQQEKIRRQQEIRENRTKALNKAREAAKGTRPVGGGIGLVPSSGRGSFGGKMHVIDESTHFINTEGKRIPVTAEEAKEIVKAFEAEPEEEDLTGAAGPEYRYLQQDEEWLPIDTAPRDGTLIQLRGKWKATDPGEPIVIEGKYEVGGFTEGWETEKGAWFCPDAWKPIQTDVDTSELGLSETEVSPEAIAVTEKIRAGAFDLATAHSGMGKVVVLEDQDTVYDKAAADMSTGGEVKVVAAKIVGENSAEVDSIIAEHLSASNINPFDLPSPGSRSQMFSSHLSSVPKQEETQLFQPGLTDKMTEEGRKHMEAMQQGFEDAGLLARPTEQ